LLPLLRDYADEGFSAWRDDWLSLDAYRGREVRLASGVKEELGVASGVDDGGALLLEQAGKIKKFSGGEVSLRLIGQSA
jgi:BirA family biotin operon repressor/biotin-[acetyl-CoA-carboxylase] ligase